MAIIKKNNLFLILFLLFLNFAKAQTFTRADSLRGGLRPERTCYDVTFYNLNVKLDIENKAIEGFNEMYFNTVQDFERMQVDLFKNMNLNKILLNDKQELTFKRDENAIFINFPKQIKGQKAKITMFYNGNPTVAANAPWDGGFVWSKDKNQKDWVGVACEGFGASSWWPNKDHLSDEPDSMAINVTVPTDLKAICNGKLRQTQPEKDNFTTYKWFVSYPINNYNVSINVGDYVDFHDTYIAKDGSKLPMNYYVLSYNLETAKTHFKQAHKVLEVNEFYFDKYPFWKDGYALIETPYLGMEHQSGIAYGNKYMRGYLGGLIPKDMNWDYIIVHETGHEWFGNSVSCNDHADMWIHESFTTYMEALFVEYTMTKKDAIRYLESQKGFIQNVSPIIGKTGVNYDDWEGSDIYYKGSWILHTLRNVINDDKKWFDLIKSFYKKYKIKNIDSQAFFDFVNQQTGKDYTTFFKQYFYTAEIPTFAYKMKQKGKNIELDYKWENCVKGFNMPILIGKDNVKIEPTDGVWKKIRIKNTKIEEFKVATELFLVKIQKY